MRSKAAPSISGPTSVPSLARIADRDRSVGALRRGDQLGRRRSRARSAGAASCSAGRRCRRRRTRWRAPPARDRRVGATIVALLPPSSRSAAEARARRSGRRRGPCAVEPVAETSGTRGSSTSASPTSRPPMSDRATGRRGRIAEARERRARSSACTASAVSGVFSDGFQTTGSPQTSASAAFHAHTATGKLKAVMTPTTPERVPRLHHAVARRARRRWSGRRAGATGRRRSRRCRSSPALRRGLPERILPASSVTSRPRSSLARAQLLADRRTSSPRRGAGTLRHVSNAACARRSPRRACRAGRRAISR